MRLRSALRKVVHSLSQLFGDGTSAAEIDSDSVKRGYYLNCICGIIIGEFTNLLDNYFWRLLGGQCGKGSRRLRNGHNLCRLR